MTNCKYYELEDGSFPNLPGQGLKIGHVNIDSLPSKTEELRFSLKNRTFDILAITESKCDNSILDSELYIEDYIIVRKDRNRNGGGVAMYISSAISFKRLTQCENDTESICIHVTSTDTEPITICVLYRPPNSPAYVLHSINNMVGNIVTHVNNDVIILGDFNSDMTPAKRDSCSTTLQSIMSGLLFYQLIDIPTRVTMVTPSSKTIIDLIFCTDPEKHSVTGEYTASFSDHYLVFTVYGNKCSKSVENVIEWRDFKHLDTEKFHSDLMEQNLDQISKFNNTNDAWEFNFSKIMRCVNMLSKIF